MYLLHVEKTGSSIILEFATQVSQYESTEAGLNFFSGKPRFLFFLVILIKIIVQKCQFPNNPEIWLLRGGYPKHIRQVFVTNRIN